MILKIITPYFSSALVLLFLELSLKYYDKWLMWLLLLFLLIAGTILFLNNFSFNRDTLGFLISPAALLFGCFAFMFFQDTAIVSQIVIIMSVFVYWLFVRNMAIFTYNPNSYVPYSLENIAAYNNLLANFLIYVSIFSFYTLSVLRLRYAVVMIILTTLILGWQTLWINKINPLRYRYFVFILAVILAEIFWALHFWPTSFIVNGMFLTVCYYLLINLGKFYFLESLDKKTTTRQVIASGLILTIILATAQWA